MGFARHISSKHEAPPEVFKWLQSHVRSASQAGGMSISETLVSRLDAVVTGTIPWEILFIPSAGEARKHGAYLLIKGQEVIVLHLIERWLLQSWPALRAVGQAEAVVRASDYGTPPPAGTAKQRYRIP